MELSACIVVYNGADEALRAAQTVLDCTRRHPLTLYLVDNASPDGSGQCLAKAAKDGTLHIREDQKVEVLCRTENGGFGTGHNTVLSLLQSRVHFILNPDIQLTADTLSDLADWMAQHPGVVMARPALTFPDGRPQRLPLRRCSVRAMVYRQLPCLKFWAKYNERYLMADKDLTKPTEIEFCTGSFSAGAPVYGHPCMAPRRAPQSEALFVAAAQPAALFLQVGLCVVTPPVNACGIASPLGEGAFWAEQMRD